ncbi:glycosyltransferase [Cellulomonas chengniuliangii]|uniref:glycosyltransferase n=1 Tax=Cellulomonas chengniuliangii TaxID=2968084 RepID=UPI001D0E5504|nr:glycosyltransferase [Cellulomonas chengniuliangii]MCC2316519.1 glycosyltransferase [Cellulomonas chengniuliangii]
MSAGTDARGAGATPGGLDLVVASLEPWDEVWRRNQHLLAGLLRADPGVRVLLVEPPADPLHDLRRGAPVGRGRRLRAIGPDEGGVDGRLWALRPTKWLPRRLDPWGDGRRARTVRAAARRLGMTHPVLWVNDPAAATLLRATAWPALYDVTDDWLLAPRTPRQAAMVKAHEDVLLERCAEVTVCSPGLAASKGARRPVTLITNGVDVTRYRAPVDRPPTLPDGRCAVYVGTVHPDRMDVGLCVDLARRITQEGVGALVVVGPVLLDAPDVARLEEAGARLLGPRPSNQVPGYLQHADVLVVPHLVDGFTDSLDPLKLYEYLAVGRPVVSTPVAGFRDLGPSSRVRVVEGSGFTAAVVEALRTATGSPGPEPTADLDPVPTWDQRVQEMAEVLSRVAATRAAPTRV